jgi:hypothetical protein
LSRAAIIAQWSFVLTRAWRRSYQDYQSDETGSVHIAPVKQ